MKRPDNGAKSYNTVLPFRKRRKKSGYGNGSIHPGGRNESGYSAAFAVLTSDSGPYLELIKPTHESLKGEKGERNAQ